MTTDTQALAARLARYAELDKKRPTLALESAEIHEQGLHYECPCCDGQGEVDGEQYINISGKAMNVLFSGIGNEFIDARNFYEQAPAMASDIALLQGVIAELVGALSASVGSHEHVLVEEQNQPPRMDELHANGAYIARPSGKALLYKKRLERIRGAITLASPLVAKGGEHG